ncbi:hypothetical protein ABKV19_020235 [Rosa sericea]
MWKRVIVAHIIVALCYFPVALVGYYIHGNSVVDNILVTLDKPKLMPNCNGQHVCCHPCYWKLSDLCNASV